MVVAFYDTSNLCLPLNQKILPLCQDGGIGGALETSPEKYTDKKQNLTRKSLSGV